MMKSNGKLKKALPEWRYHEDIDRFQRGIASAQETIDMINGMSEAELADYAKEAFESEKLWYEQRLEEMSETGELYDGEKEQILIGMKELVLLSPAEFKKHQLSEANTSARGHQEALDNIRTNYFPALSEDSGNKPPKNEHH